MLIHVALCVDVEGLDRLASALRYLVVGLVDQAVQVHLLSSDARIESMTLGPIQTLVHDRIVWPTGQRRLRQLIDAVAPQPPTVVHAVSAGSYRTAAALAQAFDADLILQVTSLADCDALNSLDCGQVQRFLPASAPLLELLETQVRLPPESLVLVRPGVLTRSEVACFARLQRAPTILCTGAFQRKSGVDRLIGALRMLHERNQPALLFLLGSGSYEPMLRRFVFEQGLAPWVTFAHPLGDIAPAMRSADIFVDAAPSSAFTADSLQAMAAGMAVVACKNSVCDHFRDEETVLICPEPTAEVLAHTIERLLLDRALARRIGAGAQEYLRAHHSTSGMAERIAACYRQLALARATFPIEPDEHEQ